MGHMLKLNNLQRIAKSLIRQNGLTGINMDEMIDSDCCEVQVKPKKCSISHNASNRKIGNTPRLVYTMGQG